MFIAIPRVLFIMLHHNYFLSVNIFSCVITVSLIFTVMYSIIVLYGKMQVVKNNVDYVTHFN